MSSYLERILDSRKHLSSQVRESLETISNLDRVGTHLSEAIDHNMATLNEAGVATPTQKSQLELMCGAMESISSNKEKIARSNYDVLDTNISMLDEEIKLIERVLNKHIDNPRVLRALEDKHGPDPPGAANGAHHPNIRSMFDDTASTEMDSLTACIPAGPGGQKGAVMIAIDPNEPVYCLCRQVQYGEMIACDNEDCDIEWFHMGCVNLHKKPKQRWLCPDCNRRK